MKKKKPKRNTAFKEEMTRITLIAREQGCKTKREVACFQVGWMFGFSNGMKHS